MAKTAVLPLNEDPPVRGYLRHAFLFSILATADLYLPWLFGGNYTQLVFDRDPDWMPLDFYNPLGYSGSGFACPFIDAQWIGRSLIDGGYGSVVPFLVESIDDGYYARLTVDEFYLPGRTSYRRRHFLHSLLVHGYDRGGRLFRVAGYLPDGEYGSSQVSFTELEAAFAVGLEPLEEGECSDRCEGTPPRFDGVGSRADLRRCIYGKQLSNVESNRVWLVRYNREARFELDFRAAMEMLEDYANSAATPSRFASILTFPNKVYTLGQPVPDREDLTFGVDIYGCLQWWMEEVLGGRRELDIIPFHVLWEHKRVMVAGLKYFERNGYLDPSPALSARYREIEAKAAHLRLLMIRSRMKRDRKLLARSLARVGSLREAEMEILDGILRAAGGRGALSGFPRPFLFLGPAVAAAVSPLSLPAQQPGGDPLQRFQYLLHQPLVARLADGQLRQLDRGSALPHVAFRLRQVRLHRLLGETEKTRDLLAGAPLDMEEHEDAAAFPGNLVKQGPEFRRHLDILLGVVVVRGARGPLHVGVDAPIRLLPLSRPAGALRRAPADGRARMPDHRGNELAQKTSGFPFHRPGHLRNRLLQRNGPAAAGFRLNQAEPVPFIPAGFQVSHSRHFFFRSPVAVLMASHIRREWTEKYYVSEWVVPATCSGARSLPT